MISALSFGQAIRDSRTARSFTQAQVADKAGVSRQAVNLLEQGGGKLSTLLKVAEFTPVVVTHFRAGSSFGERIKASREAKGMTITGLASRAAIAPNTVRAIEAGGGTVETLAALIRTLSLRAMVRPVPVEPAREARFSSFVASPGRARDPLDRYATPLPIVRLLLDHEPLPAGCSILEPAVGEHRVIERALRERGFANIVCRDIEADNGEQQDFLAEQGRYDVVLTNPPFRLHVDFIKKAKQVARSKVIPLMPLTVLTGAERLRDVWQDSDFPLARAYILTRGVDFGTSDPMSPTFATSKMYVTWFVFERGHVGPPVLNWIDNDPWVRRTTPRSPRHRSSARSFG